MLSKAHLATDIMNLKYTDPGFWLAFAIGLVSIACFIYWLVAGARKPR